MGRKFAIKQMIGYKFVHQVHGSVYPGITVRG